MVLAETFPGNTLKKKFFFSALAEKKQSQGDLRARQISVKDLRHYIAQVCTYVQSPAVSHVLVLAEQPSCFFF